MPGMWERRYSPLWSVGTRNRKMSLTGPLEKTFIRASAEEGHVKRQFMSCLQRNFVFFQVVLMRVSHVLLKENSGI
jgi:hypothetical protein